MIAKMSQIILIISTHTLTWSVTFTVHYILAIMTNFNSHAHVERDEMYNTEFTQTLNFNSHAHVERDT